MALFGLGLARPRFLPGSGSNLTGVIFASTRFLGSYPKWWRRYASSSPSQGGGTRVWSLPSQGGGGFVGLSSPSQGGDKVGRGGGGGLGLFPRNRFILISWIRSFSYTISLPNCKVPASLSGIFPLQLDYSKGMQKGGGSNWTSSFLLAH